MTKIVVVPASLLAAGFYALLRFLRLKQKNDA
jgi:hypothetical protein